MSTDDAELVERIRARDAAALAAFLEARRRPLMAYIDRHVGVALRRKIELDDIFQEVSADAVRSLPSIDLGDRDPFGWLCQIAERRIIDAHRRYFGAQKRAAGRELSLDAPAAGADETNRAGLINLLVASMTSASQAFSRGQKQIRMLEALAGLPEEHRQALQWRYLDGLPSKTIADRLGKSDGAVRVMLTRSLAKLQQILAPGDSSSLSG